MDNKNIFSTNLKKYMALQDKSRNDISNDLGFSYYTVTDWVKGKKYPRMDKVEKLANYFGVKKSDLIEDKTNKPTDNGELTEGQMKLYEFCSTVPEDKVDRVLQVMKLIVEGD